MNLPPLAHACPAARPGDHPAAAPYRVVADPSGTVTGVYACRVCGCCWRTDWPFPGWWPSAPVVFVHGVTEAEAELNRARLEAALDGAAGRELLAGEALEDAVPAEARDAA